MSKSADKTVENPGKNVKQKSGLNRAILDQGWREFIRQLEYKLTWNGGHLIQVNPRNTSRKCPMCSYTSAENRKTQATFCCQNKSCGYTNNADFVGSLNIRDAGLALLGLGGSSLELPMKVNPPKGSNSRRNRLLFNDARSGGRRGCQEYKLANKISKCIQGKYLFHQLFIKNQNLCNFLSSIIKFI